jgi:hypothetical protein
LTIRLDIYIESKYKLTGLPATPDTCWPSCSALKFFLCSHKGLYLLQACQIDGRAHHGHGVQP